MKRLLAFCVSVVASGVVLGAADRIFTNPKPDAHLKRLFPSAVAFSSLTGTPLHFTAYSTDPANRSSNPQFPADILRYSSERTPDIPAGAARLSQGKASARKMTDPSSFKNN